MTNNFTDYEYKIVLIIKINAYLNLVQILYKSLSI